MAIPKNISLPHFAFKKCLGTELFVASPQIAFGAILLAFHYNQYREAAPRIEEPL